MTHLAASATRFSRLNLAVGETVILLNPLSL